MDAITVGIIVFFLAFLAYDTLRPARPYAKVKGWVGRGIASFALYATLSTVLPFRELLRPAGDRHDLRDVPKPGDV